MALNDCCRCVKFFFVLINLLITIIGLVVLGCALWLFFDTFHYLQIAQSNDDYYRGTYLLMGVGVLMTVVGALGCIGACRESPCMLGTFFTLVLLIFVAEIASIVWVHMNKDKLREELRTSIAAAVREYTEERKPRVEALDVIQSELKCCGGEGPSDWSKSRINIGGSGTSALELGVQSIAGLTGLYKVPKSCCADPEDEVGCEAARQLKIVGAGFDAINQRGCGDRLLEFLEEHTWVVMGVVVAVMVIEVLALLIALSLCITVMRAEADYKA